MTAPLFGAHGVGHTLCHATCTATPVAMPAREPLRMIVFRVPGPAWARNHCRSAWTRGVLAAWSTLRDGLPPPHGLGCLHQAAIPDLITKPPDGLFLGIKARLPGALVQLPYFIGLLWSYVIGSCQGTSPLPALVL